MGLRGVRGPGDRHLSHDGSTQQADRSIPATTPGAQQTVPAVPRGLCTAAEDPTGPGGETDRILPVTPSASFLQRLHGLFGGKALCVRH